MSAPIVSVLMPVYNARRFVAAAIESILKQSLADFELIIIDDGSTDGSTKIMRRYANADRRIRLVSRPNTGYVRALNEALSLAQGEFIARMDADDISMPARFARQVELLRTNPDLVLVGSAVELIDGAGRLLLQPPTKTTNDDLQEDMLRGSSGIAHSAAMLRREAIVAAGGYDESMYPAEDLDLWLRLGEVGKLANVPEALISYRVHPESVSAKHHDLQNKTAFRACEAAWKRRGIVREFEWNRTWRPSNDDSRNAAHGFALQFGWWAFNSGQRGGAIVYGAKAIALVPWRSEGWRLLACGLIKPMPRPSLSVAK